MSTKKRYPRWPLAIIGAPAGVAVWSGWTSLGQLCGFGIVHPLPGIVDSFTLNTAITLPIGVETYAAYAIGAWLTYGTPTRAKRFAKLSAIGSFIVGALGQISYHMLAAQHATHAPWPITVLVASLPVVTFALATTLAHLMHRGDDDTEDDTAPVESVAYDATSDVPALDDFGAIPELEAGSGATPEMHVDAPESNVEAIDVTSQGDDTLTPVKASTASSRTRQDTSRGTRAKAERIVARNPDISSQDLAKKLSVSQRTAQRHLSDINGVLADA